MNTDNETTKLTDIALLDAVNDILGAVGEGAIDSLVDLQDIDAINALRVLKRANRTFQGKGWSFNTFEGYRLNPDKVTKRIKWLDDILYLKDENGGHLVARNGYLYDMDKQTYQFSDSLSATVVLMVDFESLPIAAQNLITAKAACEFSERYLGDDSLSKVLEARAQEAWMTFNIFEHTVDPVNILENTYVSGVKKR